MLEKFQKQTNYIYFKLTLPLPPANANIFSSSPGLFSPCCIVPPSENMICQCFPLPKRYIANMLSGILIGVKTKDHLTICNIYQCRGCRFNRRRKRFGVCVSYLTQIHDNTLMNFLPQMSSKDLNQRNLQCWNLAVHKYSCKIKLHLETYIDLNKR